MHEGSKTQLQEEEEALYLTLELEVLTFVFSDGREASERKKKATMKRCKLIKQLPFNFFLMYNVLKKCIPFHNHVRHTYEKDYYYRKEALN